MVTSLNFGKSDGNIISQRQQLTNKEKQRRKAALWLRKYSKIMKILIF